MTKNNPPQRGRPKKDPSDKMSKLLTIKMTPDQMKEIESVPVPNVRTWCRDILLKAARRLKRS